MARRCGAWQVGEDADKGAVEFRVFFPAGADPQVSAISVAGDFQPQLGGAAWDFGGGLALARDDTDPKGTFWSVRTPVELASGFYEYGYQVSFADTSPRVVADPCARYGGLRAKGSGIVVGGSRPADNIVSPVAGGRLPLSQLTIYELMIDDFTAEYRAGKAPIRAVLDRLDHLVYLGVNAIEFLPWTSWKNRDFDWGYEPFQYFAVEARYANDADGPAEKLSWLKTLISACHDRGIHVIMDGVFNHVSREFPYSQMYRHPGECPYTAAQFGGSFPGLQDLDFANTCTQELILDVCRYWIDTFGIDGIRFDNTTNFFVAGDVRGLPELLGDLRDELARREQDSFSLTLEHLRDDAAWLTNATAATSFWDNALHQLTAEYLWNGRIDGRLLNALNNRRLLSPGKIPTAYLSNHDHSQVAWLAGARDNVGATGAWWKVQPYLIALFTSTAVPLLPNGQEFGEEYFIPENDHNTGRRVTGRPLRWKIADDPIGRRLTALHRALVLARRNHPGLRSEHMYPHSWGEEQTGFNSVGVGIDVARQVAIYHRWAVLDDGSVENFVVVCNFSDFDQTIRVPFPLDGGWTDVLAGFVDDTARWDVEVSGRAADVTVGSHWGRVLFRLNPGQIPRSADDSAPRLRRAHLAA